MKKKYALAVRFLVPLFLLLCCGAAHAAAPFPLEARILEGGWGPDYSRLKMELPSYENHVMRVNLAEGHVRFFTDGQVSATVTIESVTAQKQKNSFLIIGVDESGDRQNVVFTVRNNKFLTLTNPEGDAEDDPPLYFVREEPVVRIKAEPGKQPATTRPGNQTDLNYRIRIPR